ncbi:MAG TPA: hypothetical protein VKW77_08815, partial [Acidimicrobiales bacterium]|nr:hypothetical protein [Acidimicrobiales bacterium]
MAEVDAIRHLAIERDLEFVDLDNYGVDPSASEILPADLARRHHLAVVKRKFGTPVIATADPDDTEAQDAVREAIGRDFISVVASKDQITQYLDRLFPPPPEGERRLRGLRKGRKKHSDQHERPEVPALGEQEALGRSLVELEVDELEEPEAASGVNGKANGATSEVLDLGRDEPGEQGGGPAEVSRATPAAAPVSDADVEETSHTTPPVDAVSVPQVPEVEVDDALAEAMAAIEESLGEEVTEPAFPETEQQPAKASEPEPEPEPEPE